MRDAALININDNDIHRIFIETTPNFLNKRKCINNYYSQTRARAVFSPIHRCVDLSIALK